MPLPPDQRVRFFVFVVESPSDSDLYHRRSEGDIVRQAVELNGIRCVVKTAISLQAFEACLSVGLAEAMTQIPGFIPLLHISTHGNAEGIELSNGHTLAWAELKEHLRPVNQALGGSLLVCMSSCEGYSGIRMAMNLGEVQLPYFALIACRSQPTWGETAVGYATLYHQLWRGEHIADAVQAMRVASGNDGFCLEHAEESRQAYIEYINTVRPTELQENLEQLLANATPNDQDKLTRLYRPR